MEADIMTFFDDDTNGYQQANIWLKRIFVHLSAMTAASPKRAVLSSVGGLEAHRRVCGL